MLLVLVYSTQTSANLSLTQNQFYQCILICMAYLVLLVISHVSLNMPPCLNPTLALGASISSIMENEVELYEIILVYVLPISPISSFLGYKLC